MEPLNSNPAKVLKSFSVKSGPKKTLSTALVSFIVVFLGIGTGWLLSRSSMGSTGTADTTPETSTEVKKTEEEAGIVDESKFKDSEAPIGILKEGGINGDGNYHLERPGGVSQNVYLTSTVIDLQGFVGKKVQVWGETLTGQKAGWLMDVGKIKVVK